MLRSQRGGPGPVGPSPVWGATTSSQQWNTGSASPTSTRPGGMDYGFGDTAQTGIQTVVDHGMPTAFPQNSFFFQQRRGKLDFKSLSRIDLDRVVEEVRHTWGRRHGAPCAAGVRV